LFCDDFEQGDTVGQFPGAPWEDATNSGGVVTVDATRAFSGSNAVRATAPGNATYRRAYMGLDSASGIFPAAAGGMYGRAMMWLDVAPTEVHWTFIEASGPATAGTHNALYRYGGQHDTGRLMANYETTNGVATDCWDHAAATVMPTGRWACVEWRFAVATNEMQFWLDGTEVADLHVTDQGEGCGGDALDGQWLAPPAFDNLYLGWEHYQAVATDINLWIDAVVVDDARVGCPAP
jgi:hypothetical protein